MAKVIGAVRFPNGDLRFFIYDMMVDACRPRLFATMPEASDAWNENQSDFYHERGADPGEIVEVMPTYGFGNKNVNFFTRADRLKSIITGPLDFEGAMRDAELDELLLRLEEQRAVGQGI